MTIIAAPLCVTIVQGATLDEAWQRRFFPYEVVEECGLLVKKGSGEPAPDSDMVLEDYTGCTAEAKMVHPTTRAVIATLSTATGEIVLDAAYLRLAMDYTDTAAFDYGTEPPEWKHCTAEVFVTRPSGAREKQYEITFTLDPKDAP